MHYVVKPIRSGGVGLGREKGVAIGSELTAQIAELTAKADSGSSGTTVAPPVGTRERDSMLTLIIAMAVMGYRFNPAAKRSDSIKDIVSDIEKCGLSLSDDTVRRYLREGLELLPPQENQGS
jgi:hypothetical protein